MRIKTAWERLWFSDMDARQFAVLRIAFGFLSALYLIQLLPLVESQFSGSGWLGSIRQIEAQNGGSWSLLYSQFGVYNAQFAYVLVGIGIVSSFLLMVGWRSRLTAFTAWLIWVSLWSRNPLILDGDDAILKLMCFYLMLSPCGNAWSVDSWKRNLAKRVAVWPLRLIQFQVALIYFVSGWVKFYSPEWQEGTVIQTVLIHPHYSAINGWLLINNALISGVLSDLSQLIKWWEVLFPITLLHPLSRKISLLIGACFHLGLLLTMNLRWFAVIMLALYPALLPNAYFKQLAVSLKNSGLVILRR
jgi:Vitamin K-dependent gamma-carboxylase